MALVHLPAAQHAKVPWKNGLGVSQIIASEPSGAGYDTLLWQVGGTAFGMDCPFSSLPQLDRLFMVVEGAGVELVSIDDHGATRTHPVTAMHLPYAFRGDWKTDCRLLGGPVRVFNVMARRGKARASVEFLEGGRFSKAAGEIAIAADLGSLDAWMAAGPGPETCVIETAPAGRRVLVRINA